MTERDLSTGVRSELCEHDKEAVSVFHRIGRKDKDYKEIRKNVAGGHSQQAKKLFSTSTCVVLLISMAVYFTYINVQARNQALSLNATVYTSKELGLVIHKLQGERDQTVLSISKIGSDSKLFLAKSYVDTNAVLQTLKQWPVNLQRDLATEFANKSAFQQYIVKHRRELNEETAQSIDEIDFYADMIKVLIRWLHETIKEVILGATWQSLVSYQKLVSCTEEVGIMRSIGISFFSNGGFTHHSSYVRFNKLVAAFFTNYRVAYTYSDLILPLKETALAFSGYDLHTIIETYTRQIQHENISTPSIEHASYWFDNMTLYLDMLLSKQDELWWDMVVQIEEQGNRAIPGIIASVFVIVITAIASPTMIGVVYRLVTYIKRYVTAIAVTTHDIVIQRQQTADQLRCRVPLPLANRLLAGEDLTSDYFASATVLVCQLAKAHSLPTRHPAEVIGQVARELHQTVQQMARSHDAYVLFYGSTKFVVVSGICEDSRECHASNIVDMAAAVKKKIGRNGFPTDSGRRIGVCMGIHSGGCLAIILGDAFIEMRCLLAGHAIDGATRLKKTCTSSQAITIRVSGATKRLLAEPVVYHFDRAADIVLPGEDIEIETYWLRG